MSEHTQTDNRHNASKPRRPRIRGVRAAAVQLVAPPIVNASGEDNKNKAAGAPRVDPPQRTRRMPPGDAPAPVEPPKPTMPMTGGAAAEPPARRPKRTEARPKRQPTGNYPVGNCRPPEHGKIKKGEVRNKNGRPKGARGFNTVVRGVMEEKITLRLPRGEKKMSRLEALLLKTVENGFGGNSRAALGALAMYAKAAPEPVADDNKVAAATAESDEAIIEAFKAIFAIGETATEADNDDAAKQADGSSDAEGSDHE